MADQQLNSLDRFRKQPGRLVLEAHAHCEVPAGCGGVVLRWRDPLAAVPALVVAYTPVPAVVQLDGVPLETVGFDLAPGRHVVALYLDGVDLAAGLLMMAITPAGHPTSPEPPTRVAGPTVGVLSEPDGTWRYALDEPGDDWAGPGFDDSAWCALTAKLTPEVELGRHGSWAVRRCRDAGARCLGLDRAAGSGKVWIRKTFDVQPPGG